jgi:phosphopantothenoylcysteine decarboxylase/phosphopantothenate--cysteine ligase
MEGVPDEMPRIAAKKGDRILVGFAAETEDLETNALDKLRRKRLDLIVANDVTQEGAGFSVDTNIVSLINAHGRTERFPMMSKDEVADLILDRVAAIRSERTRPRKARAAR